MEINEAYALLIKVNSILKNSFQNIKAKRKVEVCVEIDGIRKEFT